ncbi:MAG: TMEM175 family protein [Planctomycetota bacterium]
MTKNRIEAFSDGVLAIVITIMVLEMKVPEHGHEIQDLLPLLPVFSSYVLSFVYLGIYWNNHHHLLHAAEHSSAAILWANLHLLFWLSLIPFVTGWMGETDFAEQPTALYGVILLMAGIAYYILERALVARHGADSTLARALGHDLKGKSSVVLYLIAIPCALWNRWVAGAIYVLVAILWLVPDRRIERALVEKRRGEEE